MFDQIIEFLNEQLKTRYGEVMEKRIWLAKQLGYSRGTLDSILGGQREPSKHFMECIADYYGMAVIYYNGKWKIVNADK